MSGVPRIGVLSFVASLLALVGCGNDGAVEQLHEVVREVAPPPPPTPIVVTPPSAPAPAAGYVVAIAIASDGHQVSLIDGGGQSVGQWTVPATPSEADFAPMAAAIPAGAPVSIAADRTMQYQVMVTVMDALQARGIQRISLAVEPSR